MTLVRVPHAAAATAAAFAVSHSSDTALPIPPPVPSTLADQLTSTGWALVDLATVLPDVLGFLAWLETHYYSELEQDRPDVHEHRERANDRLDYLRQDDRIVLASAHSVTLKNQTNHSRREYKRFPVIDDLFLPRLITCVLESIPARLQRPAGKVSIHFFRTFEKVVMTRHKDGVDAVFLTVVRHDGDGAVTTLSRDKEGTELVFNSGLRPGQALFFLDPPFYHHTTEVIPVPERAPLRDVLIITIDNPDKEGY